MGQYLAIGLTTTISVSRRELDEAGWDQPQLEAKLTADLALSLDTYQLEPNENEWLWRLRPALLAEELIPFLEALYPALYPSPGGENDSPEVLQGLRVRDPADWLAWAEEKPHYTFQADYYGQSDQLYAKFDRRVQVHYLDILLSMEGKIVMEEYGRQFRFWQQCMAHRFREFALARSLRVYFTG